MLGYDVYIDGEKLGLGLSDGELNQWLLELHEELTDQNEIQSFEEGFGFEGEKQDDFEEFLYNNQPQLPTVVDFGKSILVIDEHNMNAPGI